MSKAASILLAALCGVCLVLSMAPFDLWPLSIVAAGALFWLLERAPTHAPYIGAAFGAAKYGFGTSWVYVSIHVYGQAPPALAALLVLLMVAILTVFVWLQWWGYGVLRRQNHGRNLLLFIALWVIGEWVMTWMLSGFPWLFLGYAHLDSPLLGYAPLGGVFLVSLTACSIGAMLALAAVERNQRSWVYLMLAAGIFAVGGLSHQLQWTESAGKRMAALVQGNTPQATKWDPAQRNTIIRNHLELSADYWGADVLMWSESAITVMERDAGALLEGLDAKARAAGTAFVTGIPVVERQQQGYDFYNTTIALGTGEGRYVKQHLVPFGEYVPFESLLRGLIQFFDLPMSGSREGAANQVNLNLGGYLGAMAICYEVAFPELVRQQAQNAAVLLTVSNDTWFGSSIGPAQHLQISRMRSAELGRWLLRATNNGMTAVVDSKGRVTATIPQFEAGVLAAPFHITYGATPYQFFGPWPVVLLVITLLLFGVAGQRHR